MNDISINTDDFKDAIQEVNEITAVQQPKNILKTPTNLHSPLSAFIKVVPRTSHSPSQPTPPPHQTKPSSTPQNISTQRKLPLPALTLSSLNAFNSTRSHYLKLDYLRSHKWHFPGNVEKREYQVTFSSDSIHNNSLIVLPTGLGKTLIAGVTMLNFIRWFPNSKVVFLAPTRPLVLQQQQAITSLLNISSSQTTILTGTVTPSRRMKIWSDPKILFIFSTAHTLANDLERNLISIQQISLLIIDEAHKAANILSNQNVIEDINEEESQNCYKTIFKSFIYKYNPSLRIIGLTATPGNNLETTLNLIKALRISKLKVKTEEDVSKHLFNKNIEEIILKSDDDIKVKEVKTIILKLLGEAINRLISKKVFWRTELTKLKKFTLVSAMQKLPSGHYAIADFCLGITLLNLRDILDNYSINDLIKNLNKNFYGSNVSKGKNMLKEKPEFQKMLQILNNCKNQTNPKMEKLTEIIKSHFSQISKNNTNNTNSGVIVFTSLRTSADEIMNVLTNQKLKVGKLIGQNSNSFSDMGQSQKIQKQTIDSFKNGDLQVLISTSVGEEGLDIGAVDLIVNFDSVNSFTRLIQRRGRTGRKRDGRVVSLVTEEEKAGNEKRNYLYSKMQENLKEICVGTNKFKKNDVKQKIVEELKSNEKYGKCFPRGFNPEFEIFKEEDLKEVKNKKPVISAGLGSVFVSAKKVKEIREEESKKRDMSNFSDMEDFDLENDNGFLVNNKNKNMDMNNAVGVRISTDGRKKKKNGKKKIKVEQEERERERMENRKKEIRDKAEMFEKLEDEGEFDFE